jgi:hypothetical protein
MVNESPHPNLRAAHNRSPSAARRGERGAAVFIVVMVLSLLSAVGLFAVRSASLADLAAGYDREGAQAALVAEYAISASAAYLANGSDTVVGGFLASANGPLESAQPCQANALPGPQQAAPRPGCYRLRLDELQTSFLKAGGAAVFAPPNLSVSSSVTDSTSSLNANEKTNATFVVEVTDLVKTGERAQGDPASLVMMTLTAISQVRPAAACAASLSAPAAGQQVMRAIVSTTSSLL